MEALLFMLSWKIFLSKIRSSSKILRITTICFSQCCRSSSLLIIQILSFNISQLLCLHFFLFLSYLNFFYLPFHISVSPREVTLFIFFFCFVKSKESHFLPRLSFHFPFVFSQTFISLKYMRWKHLMENWSL